MLLPILLIFGGILLFLQYMTSSDSESLPEKSGKEKEAPVAKRDSEKYAAGGSSLQFRQVADKGAARSAQVDTGRFLVKLSSRGGRIDGLYVKSHDDLLLPKEAIEKSGDALAIQNRAIEVTRGNGMDFQMHLYWSGAHSEHLAYPPLNNADFSESRLQSDREQGLHEAHYDLPLRFRGHRLALSKIYVFYDGENYFRQMTVLRNLERREFQLDFLWEGERKYGHLYYKPFGDIGPAEGAGEVRTSLGSGRFFYYNHQVKNRSNNYRSGGGGCFPFGCTSIDQAGTYSRFLEAPNTLEFIGSSSRYFFAYSEFLAPANVSQQRLDGVIYKNQNDPSGREAFTTVLLSVTLASRTKTPLAIPNLLPITEGKDIYQVHEEYSESIRKLQKERKDAIIIDNKVFVGVRSAEAHSFHDPRLMQAAFGLSEPNAEAEEVIYTGFTAVFSKIRDLIVMLMRWLYGFIGNYGWAIIAIALSFKLVTFPLNQMQAKSMKRMSALRPEIESINTKYKENPQEKQKRIMELYRKHNINPARGCLPILIQMPIFIALYSAFSESIELWHSPFILWMKDLSQPDTVWVIPYIDLNLNILPLIMSGSQILQQRFTTVVSDSQQKTMLYLMPVIMLFFFWQIPSGVTLYWTVQNIIAILWQVIANQLGDAGIIKKRQK